MNIPQLPTDNFYKFISFSGFIVIFFALSLFYFDHQLHIDSLSLRVEIEKVRYEVSLNESDIARLNQLKKHNPNHSSIVDLDQKVRDANRKNRYLVEDLKGKQNLVEYYKKQVNFLEPFSYFGLIFGFLVSGIGLALWYRRNQRYQDLKLFHSATQNGS